MNYIELFGLPLSGKSYTKERILKNLIKKKLKILDVKTIIIKFFLKNYESSTIQNLKLRLLINFHSKKTLKLKNFLKRKGNILKKNNRIYFVNNKKKFYHSLIDLLNMDKEYFKILLALKKKLYIKKNYKMFNYLEKEVNNLEQTKRFKITFNRWLLENIILIDILKKKKNLFCILDEGIVHKIFTIYSLKKNGKKFVSKALNFNEFSPNLIMVRSDYKKLKKRLSKRKYNNDGFIYESYEQIMNEEKIFMNFKKLISKKFNYQIITN